MNVTHYRRVYVWEVPVRIYHWVTVGCILVLAITGLLISHPLALVKHGEAVDSYWFGTVRFLHFAAAYVFTAAFFLRIYWAFAGNECASWRNFIPLTKRQIRDSGKVIRVEMLQLSNEPMEFLGHNPVAYFSYAFVMALSAFQILSGFALYFGSDTSMQAQLVGWAIPMVGSEFSMRALHYDAMWMFFLFTLVHVYLVAYQEQVEGNGALSSMAGGWKFIRRATPDRPEREATKRP